MNFSDSDAILGERHLPTPGQPLRRSARQDPFRVSLAARGGVWESGLDAYTI